MDKTRYFMRNAEFQGNVQTRLWFTEYKPVFYWEYVGEQPDGWQPTKENNELIIYDDVDFEGNPIGG